MNFLERAGELQSNVKWGEIENLNSGIDDYSEEQVRQAVVHTRQDTVLVYSLLVDLNRQARTLSRLVFGLLIGAAIVIVRLW